MTARREANSVPALDARTSPAPGRAGRWSRALAIEVHDFVGIIRAEDQIAHYRVQLPRPSCGENFSGTGCDAFATQRDTAPL
jgi:hypothetical protein